ncbi:MAG: plasmid pRiA4b ORF-3 family protein [Anaerolineae bacterium]|nr:plasmid pRiA4b ORF-3 family protein [Anaerolineae bacterium]
MPQKKPDNSPVFQLKVTLKGSKPPIWRRIQVRGSSTLGHLHDILQVVMGWTDSHMHQFIVHNQYYGAPDPEWDEDMKSEERVTVGQLVSEAKDRFIYEYDFGDDWLHDIVVEKVLEPEPGISYPRCLTGKRACPPEDIGGIWGYDEFLEAIRDASHPEHETLTEWIGGEFDPEEFNLTEVNEQLGRW